MRRTPFAVLLSALLIGMLTSTLSIQPVEANTIIVPDDYPTIQEAINAASDGDTVFVRNGTYQEKVVVRKSTTLVGENPETTILDARAHNFLGGASNRHASFSLTAQQITT